MNMRLNLMTYALACIAGTGVVLAADRPVNPSSGMPSPIVMVAATEQGGWLGVELAPIPKSLAAHLKLYTPAVMVRNVIVDGPADKAGLDQYDVIIKLDGKPVPESIAAFAETVRKKGPDATVELRLIHRGEEKTVQIKLGEMPAKAEFKYKFKTDPDSVSRDTTDFRAKVFRMMPDGNFMYEDLGELPDIKPFMPFFEMPAPMPGQRFHIEAPSMGGSEAGPGREFHGVINRGDKTIEIHVAADGKIVVTTTTEKDGKKVKEEREYTNADELKVQDAEAYELYHKMDARRAPRMRVYSGTPEEQGRMRQEWERAFKDYQERMKRHQEELREMTKRLPKPVRPEAAPQVEKGPAVQGRPDRAAFSVDASGKITATVRENDSELTLQFESEQQMKERYPKLYERYQDMRERLK